MKDILSFFKKCTIAILIVVITLLHYSTFADNMTFHMLHRELYFLPIILTSFWFGLLPGISVSILVSVVYSIYLLTSSGQSAIATVIPQVISFLVIGAVLGWLVNREKNLLEKKLADGNINVLGRAAAAVAHEMQLILKPIMSTLSIKSKQSDNSEPDKDFEAEIIRLNKMVNILASYSPVEPGMMFSQDLNKIIQERISKSQKTANKNGVIFSHKLDQNQCPSWIDPQQVAWIIDQIISNALEVSPNGGKIHISSQRGGEVCTISIKDEGPGIQPQHLEKIFTPFFTTKADGQGLSLAGCRKALSDMGGDIKVKSTLNEGTEFIIVIPREHTGKALAEKKESAVLKGISDSVIYRE